MHVSWIYTSHISEITHNVLFPMLRLSTKSMVPVLLKELEINRLIKKFKSKTKYFKVTFQTQRFINICILLWQHISVLLDRLQASIQRYVVQSVALIVPNFYVFSSPLLTTYHSFATTVSQLKISDFSGEILKVLKCYTFLWVQRRHNCCLAASFTNCVMTLYLLKMHLQTFLSIPINKKCQVLSCGTLVANERYVLYWWITRSVEISIVCVRKVSLLDRRYCSRNWQ